MVGAILLGGLFGLFGVIPMLVVYLLQKNSLKAKEHSTALGLLSVVVSSLYFVAILLILKPELSAGNIMGAIGLVGGFFLGLIVFAILMFFKK